MKTELDIIIPVYNEGKKINHLINLLKENIITKFRILICYDFDEDTTIKELKKNIFKGDIILVKNPSCGPNAAIKKGIEVSTAEIILVYMADDFENIKLINNMTDIIRNGYDLVIPSRFVTGGKFIGGKFIKKLVTYVGSFLIHKVAGVPFKDCTNAFKMFNKNLKLNIKLESTRGFTFALELTIKSHFKGFKIKELPSIWKDPDYKKSNFKMMNWLPYYIYWFLYSLKLNIFSKIKFN